MLHNWLKDDISFVHFGDKYSDFPGGIVLLDDKPAPADSRCLYIGTETNAAVFLASAQALPLVILCSDYSGDPGRFSLQPGVSLLASPLSLVTLYNRVQYHVHRFLAWDNRLRNIVYNNESIHNLFLCLAELLPYDMCLLNTGYGMIAGNISADCAPLFTELKENGYLSFESVQGLQKKFDVSPLTEHTEFSSLKEGYRTLVWPIRHDGATVARFIVNVPYDGSLPCSTDLCRIAAGYITTYMTSLHALDYRANTAFGTLIADLLESRISGEKELEERCKGIQLSFQKFFYFLLITFPNQAPGTPAPPWNYIISQLKQYFPFSNITTYRSDIIILLRRTDMGYRPTFDTAAVAKLLEYYDAYLMVGNFTRYLLSVYPMYLQAQGTLRIARKMAQGSGRIFYYEDYSNYLNVEHSALFLMRFHGLSNYSYLCHPAYLRLLRHDRNQGTDFSRVLKTYLLCGSNAAEAARSLYLHRNTMLYKIGRIEEIMGLSLSNPELNFHLLYSCYVQDYVSTYLGEDLLMLRRNTPSPTGEATPVNHN